ncbi:unnamed protein product [Malus baccata var. baccata]
MEFYALKSNESSLYLRHIPEPIENLHGILQFSRNDQNGEDARFLVEMSNTNPEYVHIKCSSNRKYLKKAPEKGTPWILAAAEQPVEDRNQPTCTLFKLEPSGKEYHDNDKVRLVHVQSGLYVRPITEGKFESCLGVVTEENSLSSFVLKADTNDKYLCCQLDVESGTNEILRFSEENSNSRFTKFTTEKPNNEDYADKNYVHIKCTYNGNYLRRVNQNRRLILAAAIDRNENIDNWECTLFKVESVGTPDGSNRITRCRLIHLQSGLYTMINGNFDLCLGGETPHPDNLDVYTLSSLPLSS